MAPKKHKSTEAGSSSSSKFDRRRFWDATAANNYATLMIKGMHRERGVDITLGDYPFVVRAKNRGWEQFVNQPTDAVKSLVREFYANLMVKHEDYKVRVRGKMVAFDSRTINAIYGMPDHETDGYREMMGNPVEYDEILEFLCFPGAVWKLNSERRVVNFESKYLTSTAYLWFQFIAARVMPTNHTSEVTKERAVLLYCILTGRTVDIGLLVQTSILQAVRGTTTLSMPHSSLITELCRHAGVTWDDREEMLPPKAFIDIMGTSRMRRRREVDDAPEDAQEQRPIQQIEPPQPPPRRQSRTLTDRMTDLERGLEQQRQQFAAHQQEVADHWRMTREHMMYMHDFTAALAQRFPPTSPEQLPFPPPPSWPTGDDDDEEMDEAGEEHELADGDSDEF